jgi:hypothetical protein
MVSRRGRDVVSFNEDCQDDSMDIVWGIIPPQYRHIIRWGKVGHNIIHSMFPSVTRGFCNGLVLGEIYIRQVRIIVI